MSVTPAQFERWRGDVGELLNRILRMKKEMIRQAGWSKSSSPGLWERRSMDGDDEIVVKDLHEALDLTEEWAMKGWLRKI